MALMRFARLQATPAMHVAADEWLDRWLLYGMECLWFGCKMPLVAVMVAFCHSVSCLLICSMYDASPTCPVQTEKTRSKHGRGSRHLHLTRRCLLALLASWRAQM